MSKLGWSYPAGCNGPPDDEPVGCEVCGREVGSCECPECPVCGVAGDPACHREHGMEKPVSRSGPPAGRPRMRNVKLTDAEWSALARIARHYDFDWGGIPSRSDAVRFLIRRQIEQFEDEAPRA